jgi:trimeric autotransporter adhesin
MSTKTTFKRIALVAVAALGFGMLSVVPSNSDVIAHTLAIDSATDTVAVGETATALLTQSFITAEAQDSVTVTATITSSNGSNAGLRMSTYDSSTSSSTVFGSSAVTSAAASSVTQVSGVTTPTSGLAVNFRYTLNLHNPTVAGTYTVRIYATPYNTGTNTSVAGAVYDSVLTWTITVTAPDRVATTGTSILRTYGSGNTSPWGGTAATSDSTVVGSRALGTAPRATIWTTQTNAAGTADESLTAVISGPGYITTSAAGSEGAVNPGSGFAVTVKSGNPIYVWANGTAGEATITVKTVSGVTLGTESVKFYGAVTTLTVTSIAGTEKLIGLAGVSSTISNTQTSAFAVTATDALGTGVPLTALDCTSSNGSVVASCSAAIATPGQHRGAFNISYTTATTSTSGQAATLTISTPDPLSTTTPAATLSVTKGVTTGGTIATEVISLHATDLTAKSTFNPGEAMVVAVTAKDASGNPVVDGSPTPTLTANKAIGGANNSNSITFGTYLGGMVTTRTIVSGVVLRSDLYYAPATSGEFTITGLSGNATASRISVTGTVGDDAATTAASAAADAAAEATDAANAATDAANAAAEAADAATAAAQDAADAVAALSASVSEMVNALKKQITSLTNLVIKIQKKVRA